MSDMFTPTSNAAALSAFGISPQASPSQGAYPTFQNAYGLGTNGQSGQAAPQPTGAPSLASPPSTSTSMGFNPWSITGESNARGPGSTPGQTFF